MPRLEEGMVTAMRADATLGPLVANSTSPLTYRIYHERAPQNPTYPLVIFSRVSTFREPTLDGLSTLTRVLLTVSALCQTTAQMDSMTDAIRGVLDGVRGSLGGVTVQWSAVTDEQDVSLFDGDQEIRVLGMDVEIVLHET